MQKPNILLMLTDQQRYDTICASGASWMKTPNLDRLIADGCLYENAYSPNPICMPARHCLLTGKTSRHHGYHTNLDQPIKDYGLMTLPRFLGQRGYVTAGIGKMHFYPHREHHGFDEMHLMEELPAFREEDAYLSYLAEQGYRNLRHIHGVRHALYHRPQRSLVPAEHHGSSWVATKTIDFIRQNKSKPWFCFTGWVHPHPPCAVPDEYLQMYRDADLPEPVKTLRPPFLAQSSDPWFGDTEGSKANRSLREAYYGAVSLIDYNVGRIMQCLEEQGQAENTIVIFTSDHGEMLGDRGLWQKMLPYEAQGRIPFILRWPGRVEAGSKSQQFIDHLDLIPTIADAIDQDLPEADSYPGSSLFTKNGRDRTHQWVETGCGYQRSLVQMNQRYKYVFWYNGGIEELYDRDADPMEMHNLIGTDQCPCDILNDLRMRCMENERALGGDDTLPSPGQALEPKTFCQTDLGTKYPLWANNQFPDWGDTSVKEEITIMEREILAAVKGLGSGSLTVPPEYHQAWLKRWKELGGSQKFAEKLWGEELG